MQEEAEKEKKKKKKKGSSSGSDRKKPKEQRIAIPLSRLDPISRKKRSSPPPRDSPSSSRRPSSVDLTKTQEAQVYPPMGYFPPPSGRTRPRSGTSLSQRPPSRMRDDRAPSPFNYEYVQRPSSANRHVSESMARPSSRGIHPDQHYGWDYSPPSSSGSRDGPDPFQYQTAGPRAPYAASNTGAAAVPSRRHVSGPAESYMSRRPVMAGAPAAARGRHSLGGQQDRGRSSSATDSQTSEEDTTSDELGHGAQIREPPPPQARGREEIVVEVSPERAREGGPSKKKSSSPVKRKPVQSGGGGRSRRKR
ncbi:hypothetical protein NLU13_3169 [Sarocladium strictum]|uniref:Uncharacterized protein n=1 Tax=Sarocladium strictum TaxID=5046 RepID=A0AA39GMB6_SARSR|nr:hypothetical protein NLU13_3169 [Sarocladium strictum]